MTDAPPRMGEKEPSEGPVYSGLLELIEGTTSPDHVTVIEYPSMRHAREWLASEEYARTREQRAGTADFTLMLLPAVAV